MTNITIGTVITAAAAATEPIGGNAGHRQRRDHLHEDLPLRCAVHLGGLLEFPRDLTEEGRQRVDGQGQRERQIRDDQPWPGVEQVDPPLDVEHRVDQRYRREPRDHQGDPDEHLIAGEPQPRDGVGGHGGQHDRDERGDQANPDRVHKRPDELRGVEDPGVVGPRPLGRPKVPVGERRRFLERQGDEPPDGEQRPQHGDHVGGPPADPVSRRRGSPRRTARGRRRGCYGGHRCPSNPVGISVSPMRCRVRPCRSP